MDKENVIYMYINIYTHDVILMRQKSKESSSISGHKRLEEHYIKLLQPEKDK